ncbi:helicase HerA domain-containing protein [Natronomonas sp.]|uniref:helicase HerA domain-containing protein n=1 Tax=Natronomonas sp. TaxID=2184060 RepID=UPI002633A53B|nr:DUF87 domain-containing protein [Natronomonas sp.]
MAEETITVGETTAGSGAGTAVDLPVVDVLTGRGFVTGKSGSGKSNSASVVCEKLLDEGYGILIVDIDGEYYGLKEEYEILHVGADEECDLRVNVEHAEKIAQLALERNVPIILDVSSFLDESDARELLTEVTKQLFVKEKKLKQPFLMLVEEVHEYVPEGGGIDECGRMLIKISKRGRKHGLGIVGISQRPADVKKDFITQCDWLVWHRLTWNNDTNVVGRILGSGYADAVEDLADGEGFLMTDWNESVSRVQFERKRTFDAGATPGLEDFERPELKSVSGDLVDELEEITDERDRRQNRIAELESELERREERIEDLERQLSEARDLERMADRFSRAMMEQVTGRPLSAATGRQSELDEAAPGSLRRDPELEAELDAVRNGEAEPTPPPVPDAAEERNGDGDGGADPEEGSASRADDSTTGDRSEGASTGGADDAADGNTRDAPDRSEDAWDFEPFGTGASTDADAAMDAHRGASTDGSDRPDPGRPTREAASFPDEDPLVAGLRDELDELSETALGMLRRYRTHGPATPQEVHAMAGGAGDRGPAYAANRTLRRRGFVEHVGRGQYDYALSRLVREELSDPLRPNRTPGEGAVEDLVDAVEAAFLDRASGTDGAADASGRADDRPAGTVSDGPLDPSPEL